MFSREYKKLNNSDARCDVAYEIKIQWTSHLREFGCICVTGMQTALNIVWPNTANKQTHTERERIISNRKNGRVVRRNNNKWRIRTTKQCFKTAAAEYHINTNDPFYTPLRPKSLPNNNLINNIWCAWVKSSNRTTDKNANTAFEWNGMEQALCAKEAQPNHSLQSI